MDPTFSKIISSNEKETCVIHTKIPNDKILNVEVITDEEKRTFKLLLYTDLNYEFFKLYPSGKHIEILIGEIKVWEYDFSFYIDVASIKKEKKDRIYIVSGKLIAFNEILK